MKKILEKQGRFYYISGVDEVSEQGKLSWCTGDKNEKKLIYNQFRILIDDQTNTANKSSLAKYYIIDDSTGIIYETGDFFLQILFELPNGVAKRQNTNHVINYKGHNLFDITDRYPSHNNSLLHICNRAPKIRHCPTAVTYNVEVCAYTYNNKTREFCPNSKQHKSLACLSTSEYELDPNGLYLRVCDHDQAESAQHRRHTAEYISTIIAGYMSSICLAVSMIFMLATLTTYALFKELRNIPGWNIINVTLALLLAQFFFFVGSFIDQYPSVCFAVAVWTHYGLLASFCWMNVIAFDLYRNFRQRSAHVLLKTIRVRDRLLRYALFGWLSPLTIVIGLNIFKGQV